MKIDSKQINYLYLRTATIIFLLFYLSGCNRLLSLKPNEFQKIPVSQISISDQSEIVSKLKTDNTKIDAEVIIDFPYSNHSESQKLDLYIPEGKGPFPLIIIIHGGGFMTGDKANKTEMERVELLLQEGFAAASVNYRLSDEAIFPAQILDVKTAVRALRENARAFRLDPDRFGAWGSSAGGTLAALLGTSCDVPELEGSALGFDDQDSCIQAVVDWFGLVDLLKMDEQLLDTDCPAGHDKADSAESLWVGAPIQTVPDRVAMTNPIKYIDENAPPFFIQHGSDDCRVPPQQSRMLANALIATIGEDKVEYSVIEGAGHGGAAFKTEANLNKVISFFNSYLK